MTSEIAAQEPAQPFPSSIALVDSPWWRQASRYVASGIAICRKDPLSLLALVALFAIPPLAAAWIGAQPGDVAYWLAWGLPWITITLGNITMVLAIEDLDAGRPLHIFKLLPVGVRWLPRYLWANGITTVLFWVPQTIATWAVGKLTNFWAWPSFSTLAILLLPMLFWHVRLVFATYAAIVDDYTGMRSVRISLGIAQGRWRMVAAAFALSVLVEAPIAGPLYLLLLQAPHSPLHQSLVIGGFTWTRADDLVGGALLWVLLMLMRPIFIATLHEIYEDYRPQWKK
jgi:hypothetical protein